jgi:hypothetical protein
VAKPPLPENAVVQTDLTSERFTAIARVDDKERRPLSPSVSLVPGRHSLVAYHLGRMGIGGCSTFSIDLEAGVSYRLESLRSGWLAVVDEKAQQVVVEKVLQVLPTYRSAEKLQRLCVY